MRQKIIVCDLNKKLNVNDNLHISLLKLLKLIIEIVATAVIADIL